MKAQKELNAIKSDFQKVSSVLGTKPKLFDMVAQINEIKSLYKKASEYMTSQSKAKNEIIGQKVKKGTQSIMDFFSSMFGLDEGEVNNNAKK